MAEMLTKNFEEKELVGLKDGGHTYLKCSNCRKLLADLWVTNPSIKEKFKYRAKCPYCKDKSYIAEIEGGIAYAGIYNQIDEDNDKKVTDVEHFEFVDGIVEFTIKKV